DEDWFDPFDRGEFEEGRAALEAQLAKMPDLQERTDHHAFALHIAASAGSVEALEALLALAGQHPKSSRVGVWTAPPCRRSDATSQLSGWPPQVSLLRKPTAIVPQRPPSRQQS